MLETYENTRRTVDSFFVLPTGVLEREKGVRAELEEAEKLSFIFSWPPVLFEAEKIMRAVCSFRTEIADNQWALLTQGL